MGLLRVYLALCVITAHSAPALPWQLHDPVQAVEIFYVISGFYMALILSNGYPAPGRFYISRFLRIFPAYWIVLFCVCISSVVMKLVSGSWLFLTPFVDHPLARNGAAGFLFALSSNLTLFGQDWVMFLQHDAGTSFGFTHDFWLNRSPLWQYLLVPQCWSIGVELSFYLVVPYLRHLSAYALAVCIALGLAFRWIVSQRLGLFQDPWDYRFFPFELPIFMLGMLGYHLYARFASRFNVTWLVDGIGRYLCAVAVLLALLRVHALAVDRLASRLEYHLAVLLTYPFWAVILVVLFMIFRRQPYDRFIGELSYPIYLVHYAVIGGLWPIFEARAISPEHMGEMAAIVSIVLAVLLRLLFLKRIDEKRHSLADRPAVDRSESQGPASARGPARLG